MSITREPQEKIAEVHLGIEKVESEYDLNTAPKVKYGTMPQLEEQLEQVKMQAYDLWKDTM